MVYVTIFVILEIVFEILLMVGVLIAYWRKNSLDMQGVEDITPLTEEERREVFCKKYLSIGVVYFIVLVGLIAAAFFIIEQPKCGENHYLNLGVCTKCDDSNCKECSNGDTCETCYEGYHVADGKCKDCDLFDFIACSKCVNVEECLECSAGYRLYEGKCLLCDMMVGCAKCNAADCLSCLPGYYMNSDGVCVSCDKITPYCDRCD